MATGPGASPTSTALFRFALDPEKHREVDLFIYFSPGQTFGRWRVERTAAAKNGGVKDRNAR